MRKKLTDSEIKKQVEEIGYSLLEIKRRKNSGIKIVIKDKNNYFYEYYLSNLRRYKPSIAEPNNPFSILNISRWLKLNKSNFEVCDRSVYVKARVPITFYCKDCKGFVNKSWNEIYSYTSSGCGICSGRIVSDKNRLSKLYPKVSKEWDYVKNYPLTPRDVSYSSDKGAWWICKKCKHSWKTNTMTERTTLNYGCPSCSGKVVSDKNRLTILYPEIASQWNKKKNKNLKPENFSYGSNKKVWWLCEKCGNQWFVQINNRCRSGGAGCLKCFGKEKLTIQYCKRIAKEKGYILKSDKYINAHKKMIFIHKFCGEDFIIDWHHFQQGQECLACSMKRHESKMANALKIYYKKNYNSENEAKKVKNPLTNYFLRYDIYLPKQKIFIEINGGQHYYFIPYWHKTIENFKYSKYKDKLKKDYAIKNGIYIEIDLRDNWTFKNAVEEINKYIEGVI